jgi:hypothetical protein
MAEALARGGIENDNAVHPTIDRNKSIDRAREIIRFGTGLLSGKAGGESPRKRHQQRQNGN